MTLGRITAGPVRDPAANRAGTPAIGEVIAPELVDRPAPPAGLDHRRVNEWLTFWASDVAGAVDAAAHLPTLERLFALRQESDEAHRDCRDNPTLEGSKGQLVENPRCRHAVHLDTEIRHLEDRFGMSPLAQLRLGVEFGKAAKARRDTKKILDEEREAADRYADPRLTDTGSAAAL